MMGILAVLVLLLSMAAIPVSGDECDDDCAGGIWDVCDQGRCDAAHGKFKGDPAIGGCWYLDGPILNECHNCKNGDKPVSDCMDYESVLAGPEYRTAERACTDNKCGIGGGCQWSEGYCFPAGESCPGICDEMPYKDKSLEDLCRDELDLGGACDALPYGDVTPKSMCWHYLREADTAEKCESKIDDLRNWIKGLPVVGGLLDGLIGGDIEELKGKCEEYFGTGGGNGDGEIECSAGIDTIDKAMSLKEAVEQGKKINCTADSTGATADRVNFYSINLNANDTVDATLDILEIDPVGSNWEFNFIDKDKKTILTGGEIGAFEKKVEEGGTYYFNVSVKSTLGYTLIITVTAAAGPPIGTETDVPSEDEVLVCMELCKAEHPEFALIIGLIYALCVIFRTLEMIAAILAALVLAYSGLLWLGSESPEAKHSAKMLGIRAIIGLIIIMVVIELLIAILSQPAIPLAPFGCQNIHVSEGIQQILCYLLLIIEGLAAAVAAIAIVFSAMELFGTEDPERRDEAKRRIAYVLIGLIVIAVAVTLVNALVFDRFKFDCAPKPEEISVSLSTGLLCTIFLTLQGIVVVLGVLSIAYSGVRWLTSESAEDREGAKRIIVYTVLGVAIALVVLELMNLITTGVGSLQPFGPDQCSGAIPANIKSTVDQIVCIIFRAMQFAGIVLAVLALMYSGLRWMASENPGERTRAKRNAISVIVGLMVLLLAINFIISLISGGITYTLDCSGTTITDIEEPMKYIGCIIMGIIEVVAFSLAVLVVMLAGIKWMTSEDPEERSGAKNIILHTVIGLLFVFLAVELIGAVLGFPGAGVVMFDCSTVTVPEEALSITDAIDYVVCILIGIIEVATFGIAILVVMYSGLRWMTSEDPEGRVRAKNMVLTAIIGLIIVFTALYLISAVLGIFVDPLNCAGVPVKDTLKLPIQYISCLFIKIIQDIVTIVATLTIVYAGLIWLTADSPEGRNKAKSIIVHTIIAAVVIIIATYLIEVIIFGFG